MEAGTPPLSERYRPLLTGVQSTPGYFLQPWRLVRSYRIDNLRPDLVAGLTVGVVSLPQGIAFAILAGLPPAMGVYASIVAAIVAALWGSSNHLSTGPTNSSSLLVFSILLPLAVPGSLQYVAAAGMLAVMAGVFRVGMGLARLGVLVNFVSDSVIVGFTAGAGVLIIVGQLRALLGLSFPSSPRLTETVANLATYFPEAHLLTLLLGAGTIVVTVLIRRARPGWPAPLIAMGLAAAVVWVLDWQGFEVAVLGALPRGLPPVADLPLLDLSMIGELSMGALAIAVIGLVEAMAIARSIASQTGQRLDSNQEFVGQGLANIAAGFFSGYPCSGSFNRSSLNYESGARTPMASVFSGLFVLLVMFVLAPVAAYVPLSAIAATLMLSAYAMIDRQEMARIWQGTQGDRFIMVVTLLATLLLPLQFAVLTGVLMSLVYYIWRTSLPRVESVVPDEGFNHLVSQVDSATGVSRPACPQLGILEIRGDLYFGAAPRVEDAILQNLKDHPDQRFLLLRMLSVTQIDISGVHMLESVVRTYRERGGDVFLVRVQPQVMAFMQSTDFDELLGADHFLDED
ncbi:MAG: SulP family inorganic anion transporter, partial [Anaerolineae bacterium]